MGGVSGGFELIVVLIILLIIIGCICFC
ncbi:MULTISPECIES: YjcZ family sporulation protein [Fictibacillus]|uniref:YjcZ family sporulation protein n=1 Tax=Fictibacillus terranigra TaxID=3058424 RepID=A0ABT8ECW2_9BACL|nr:YjcZ family sporulation protein [Fictibacillus sp. CENA-BCM004]MDN4075745.1 YjcZ family sporulation protein [Fictibacillus sp. CENA-BCM004]